MSASYLEVVPLLAVDDNPNNLIALEAALSGDGYRIVGVTSGEEAVKAVAANEFAAILLDVQMPGIDGYETAELIRSIQGTNRTPILFLTANYQNDENTRKGYATGAVDYIYKPYNPDYLRAKLSVFADLFRRTKELEQKSALLSAHERKEKEREIEQIRISSERRYHDLVDGIKNGVVWSSKVEGYKTTFVSAQAEEVFGFPISHFYEPLFFFDRIHEEDRQSVIEAHDQALMNNCEVTYEARFRRSDNKWIWVQTTFRVTDLPEGKEFRGLTIDITKQKETELALREMIRVRDEFLSIASHELKTPLTPLQLQVQGFSRLYKTGRLFNIEPHRLTEMLNVSEKQVEVLTRLVDQLLDISRLTTRNFELNLLESDLSESVKLIADLYRGELEVKGIDLSIEVPEVCFGRWDKVRIEQVISNLLNNAIKYGEGKPIHITLERDSRQAVLKVRDFGIGIQKEDHERIFARFERAVSPRSFSGLGLGLYISKQLVEYHGGKIYVASELGEGTTVTVELPLVSSEC